jgi:hypothetical protein
MKKAFGLIAICSLLLASCAGVPKPERDSDSLVVGSFVSSFPDGFFAEPARTMESGLRVNFINQTSGKEFSVITTNGGFFQFLSNGTDAYAMTGYAFNETVPGKGMFTGGANLNYTFTVQSHCVFYLGHFTFISAHPQMTTTGLNRTGWDFERSLHRANKADDVRSWLQTAAADSPWLSYDFKGDFQQ